MNEILNDHEFVGEGIHCEYWPEPTVTRSGDATLSFSSRCGYPRNTHPVKKDDDEN